jgi:hypothetical protein
LPPSPASPPWPCSAETHTASVFVSIAQAWQCRPREQANKQQQK